VITLLVAREIWLDPAARDRILAEPDPQRLDHWIVRAASCTSITELFDEI
jgi:hypothetical protein